MRVKTVPSAWLRRDGRRLDCGPYMSGALEAKVRIESLSARTVPLKKVTVGLVNAGRIRRIWVEDIEHGRPFLSSTDILQADLSGLKLISHRAVKRNPKLVIREGWTLITRAGSIGRMAYARPEMDAMACTEHVLRVIPDERRILPGYLFAYLSSKFGVPLVVGGTYGSIIQHIEPHHIADLPVPRLGKSVERRVHDLVEHAARKRTAAAQHLLEATRAVAVELDLPPSPQQKDKAWLGYGVPCSELNRTRRFEGYFHNPVAQRLDEWTLGYPAGCWRLGDVADVFDVPPFKHIYVGPDHGLPFYTSGELFRLQRSTDKHLSKTRTRDLHKYVVKKGWVLLARSGQLGGIIGRPQFVDSVLHEATTSDHVIRIVPRTELVTPGFLYAYLATAEIGYPLLTRTMTGASVPALWPTYLNEVPVVKASGSFMEEIDQLVQQAFELRIAATVHEIDARRIVEQAIEGAA